MGNDRDENSKFGLKWGLHEVELENVQEMIASGKGKHRATALERTSYSKLSHYEEVNLDVGLKEIIVHFRVFGLGSEQNM